jgi:hypothetical protein
MALTSTSSPSTNSFASVFVPLFALSILHSHHSQTYGHIQNVSRVTPPPSGGLRSSVITFDRIRSATIARNVLNDFYTPSPNPSALTRLRTAYQRPVQPHVIRDWISSHPKISLPIIIFLIGTLTYTVCHLKRCHPTLSDCLVDSRYLIPYAP